MLAGGVKQEPLNFLQPNFFVAYLPPVWYNTLINKQRKVTSAMIKGVIFDMDGLMFDTERIWGAFWRPALAAHGLPYKQGLADAVRGTAGGQTCKVLRSLYGEECDAEGVWQTLHELVWQEFMRAPVPEKPGLQALLVWLAEQGIPAAVASSSKEFLIRHHLEAHGLQDYFAAVICGANLAHSKPHPEIFLKAAEALGIPPAECLVLEDSYNGVRAGAAGGFVTVMVPDIAPANDEMRGLYTAECADLFEVLGKLQNGEL